MRPLPPQGSALSPELRARSRPSVAAVELDRLGARAWPALEEERLGGWLLRFARGTTGRANSVLAHGTGDGEPLDARIDAVEAAYRRRGLPPKFMLTPATELGLPAALRARGYAEDAPTHVMTAALGGASGDAEIAARYDERWLAVYRAVETRGDDEAARGILDRIALPTAYASRAGEAVGLGVLDGAWLGIYCMATLPHARRRGHARQIVGALLGWGGAHGARFAHLCTHSTNRTAQELYRSVGFEVAQDYVYFTAAG